MYSARCPGAWDGRLDCSAPAILLRAKKSEVLVLTAQNQRIENNAISKQQWYHRGCTQGRLPCSELLSGTWLREGYAATDTP